MKKLPLTLGALLLAGALPAASIEAFHDEKTGVTELKFDHGRPGAVLDLFRSAKPIDQNNWKQARCIAEKIPPEQKLFRYTVPENGEACYALVADSSELLAATTAPIKEFDRTPPAPPRAFLSYVNGRAVLSWRAPGARNPEKIRVFEIYADQNSDPVAVLKSSFLPVQRFDGDSIQLDGKRFFVAARDSSGNRSDFSAPLDVAFGIDLALSGADNVVENPDLSTSKMYPKPGETVRFSAKLRNTGARDAGLPFRVRIADSDGTILAEPELPPLAADAETRVEWERKITKPGPYSMTITLDPDGKIAETNRANNTLTIKAGAASQDLYFIWYGDVNRRRYANTTSTLTENDVIEARRRGSAPGAISGALGDLAPAWIRQMKERKTDFFFIDEISPDSPQEKAVLAAAPKFREACPKGGLAVYNIGYDVTDAVEKQLKSGEITLVMFEIYIMPGNEFAPTFDKVIATLRRRGIADRCVFCLCTAAGYNTWADGPTHAAHVVRQMEYIRAKAPEMPGFAFWGAGHPEVMRDADAACYRLFIENASTQPTKED